MDDTLDHKLLLSALTAIKNGDFSTRLPMDWTGVSGKIADTLNDIVEINGKLAKELERVGQTVGKEGKLDQRASLGKVGGRWDGMVESLNWTPLPPR